MFHPHQSVLKPAIAHHFSRDIKKNTEQKQSGIKMAFLPKPGHISI